MKTETKIRGRLPAELRASSLVLLKRLGFTAKQLSFEEYEKAGLSPYHHAILALLDESVPESQAAIADSLGYDRGTLVGLLDELEEKGLVERKRDPDDRRRHLVRLTATASARSRRSARSPNGWRMSSWLRSTPSSGRRCTHFCRSWRRGTSRAAPRLPELRLPDLGRPGSAQRSEPCRRRGLEPRQRLADEAVVDARCPVLAAG